MSPIRNVPFDLKINPRLPLIGLSPGRKISRKEFKGGIEGGLNEF